MSLRKPSWSAPVNLDHWLLRNSAECWPASSALGDHLCRTTDQRQHANARGCTCEATHWYSPVVTIPPYTAQKTEVQHVFSQHCEEVALTKVKAPHSWSAVPSMTV